MDVKTQSRGEAALPTEKEPPSETLGSFALFLLKLLIAVLIFRSFIFAPFTIPSESMLPRLQNGDYLVAAKWSYGYSSLSLPWSAPLIPGRIFASQPERGDIVIFKHPVDQVDYVKRVIGLPGDTIAMEEGQLILNGEPVLREAMPDFEIALSPNTDCEPGGGSVAANAAGETVCRYTRLRETLPGGRTYEVLDFGLTGADDYGPTIVPEGHVFVMGDNRDNSQDSRFAARSGGAVGIISQDLLVAEATIIMFSTDGSAAWINPISWFTAARWDRIGQVL